MKLFSRNKAVESKQVHSLAPQIKSMDSPPGWSMVTHIAVGGMTDLGFSRTGPCLLIISGQGRGVLDCTTGEKVARDYESYGDWSDESQLTCLGIGPIESETIMTCGLHGGGLPHVNNHGDSIQIASANWPDSDLYFCSDYGSCFIEKYQHQCCHIDSGDLRSKGFSWCGKYLVSATSSDLKLWKKL